MPRAFFHFKIIGQTEETRRLTGVHGGAPIDANVPVDTVVQHFDVTHGVNYLMLNGHLRHSFFPDGEAYPHGRVQLYGGGGLGPVIGHPRGHIGDRFTTGPRRGGTAYCCRTR